MKTINFDIKVFIKQYESSWKHDYIIKINERRSVRKSSSVTIDGADAKDFDDAVSIEPLPDGGSRLGVHIADVCWYVQPGSVLDAEAQARGTSVYLADRVLPMLPETISNGCCSLLPGQDRLTLSAILNCDAQGNLQSYRLERSVIHSQARLVYGDVNLLLQGDETQLDLHKTLLPDLQAMATLASRLRALRFARGALDLDVDEAAITVDEQGEPTDISLRPRGTAERLIEEFMLLANEAVGRHAREHKLPCLYRVHETMDVDKAQALATFLRGLGLRLKGAHAKVKPMALQQVLREAEDMPEYPVVAQLVLRAMQKARYDPEPLGHFGLAAEDYCHFTSPIRRYPDLFVHRMITAQITGQLRFVERAMHANAPALAVLTSSLERNAMEAERAVEKLMMARYMAEKIGEEYEGRIVGAVEWGFYVSLQNGVEGLVHIRRLPGFWTLNRELHCLVGDAVAAAHIGGEAVYRLGQTLRVRVDAVDVPARQIDFVVAE